MTNQNIIEFLNTNSIEWFPINLTLKWDDDKQKTIKTLLPIEHKYYLHKKVNSSTKQEYDSYKPEQTDFKTLTKDMIQQRQELLKNKKFKFTHLAISTHKIQHIDIDTTENIEKFLDIANVSPYYKSATKDYGKHIFITQDSDTTKTSAQFTTKEVELLINGWSYAPIDCQVINSNAPIYHYKNIIDDLTISKTIKVDNQKYELKLVPTQTSYEKIEIKAHCDNIDIKYIDEYHLWTKLVWSLKSINDIDNAIYLSKRSSKYDEKVFYTVWNSTMDEISIGTIIYYSKLSNPEKFASIKSTNLSKFLYNACHYGTSEFITQLFYEIYKEDFVAIEGEKNHYYYNGVLWKKTTLELRRKFTSKEFMKYFLEYSANQGKEASNCDDEDKMKRKLQLVKSATDVAISITKSCQITDFLKSIPMYITKEVEFEKKPHIFCFNNAVYDLKQMKFISTPVRDDYMTFSTGYDYSHPSDQEIKTLQDMFEKIFPDKAIRKLYLMILSTQLYGSTLEKFIMANGTGRNGKGFTNELMLHLLGEYGMTGCNAILMSPLKLGGCPEIAQMKKKRGIIFREPSTDYNLNSCTIKDLTGGDTIPVRDLYSSNVNTPIKHTIILECNKRPNMSDDVDDAMLKRLIDIPFVASFTDDINEVDETNHIYLGDSTVKEIQFKENHRCALFQILIMEWKDYYEAGMKLDPFIPDVIKKRGQDYLTNSTPILALLKEKYDFTPDNTQYIKIDDLFSMYKRSDNYLNMSKEMKRKITKKSFIEFCASNPFTRKYYKERIMIDKKPLYNILTNYIEKSLEEEEEEEEH